MLNKLAAILIAFLIAMYCNFGLADEINFHRDIRPIISEHCIKCHNASRSESGLSLHSFEAAQRGGDSGNPVLGGTRETNEIFRRVTSTDLDIRMPFESPALSQEEVDLIGRWVDQGAAWPEIEKREPRESQSAFGVFLSRWIKPYVFWYAGLLIAILLIERLKSKRDQSTLRRIGLPIYLIAAMALALGITTHQIALLESRLEMKHATPLMGREPVSITEIFGDPPIPVRPSHEPRLGGLYYRGNNERKPELYNNGHYRTATLGLFLVNQNNELMDYGSAVSGDLFIRLIIDRAPQATKQLFSEEIMSGLFLAPDYRPEGVSISVSEAAVFKPTDSTDRWHVTYPVMIDRDEGSGLIYLYRGKRSDDQTIKTIGMPQIGIVYELKIEEGRIAKGSELWLDAIYFPENILPPAQQGMVPWNEWYGYHPIPTIKGEQTSDPILLGVDSPDGTPAKPSTND